jgi:hypothetical protein
MLPEFAATILYTSADLPAQGLWRQEMPSLEKYLKKPGFSCVGAVDRLLVHPLMTRMNRIFSLFALNLLLLPGALLHGQEPTPSGAEVSKKKIPGALAAISAASARTGKSITKIAEVSGSSGKPFPAAWSIKFHDARSSTYLTDLVPGGQPVPADHTYSQGKLPTFFDISRVKLDVVRAFELANAEATYAKIGFDSLDFTLRAREFSQEPVWTLRLVNLEDQLVGVVELSAESGRIYRTVWLRRSAENGGEIRVIDSAMASSPSAAGAASGNSEGKDAKAVPQNAPQQ